MSNKSQVYSLATAVAPGKGKIIQNGTSNFLFSLSQSSGIALKS